jgi:YVTN family beta-propeller protein
MKRLVVLGTLLLNSTAAVALPTERDRVYTADQNSNTVSVIDPASNTLLGQIRLGNPRPDILSPLYKGEVNVHGLGFSPDHKTLAAVSTVTNSVTFIDTATNKVKGTAYIGRNPHEAFFTPDGRQVWATVRGEDHLAVIDAATYREVGRIPTTSGPGMTIFAPDGKLAFVCNSFNPVVEVVDVAKREVIKKIPVVSPFSPFIQVTPDGTEVWLTHKDIGKVTRIDTMTLEVKGTIDTGPITNHLAFGQSGGRTLAYVTVGGENAVKVFTLEASPTLVKTIPVGALPHGIWASGDGSRIYVGLENGDAVDVIDTSKNETIARIPVGQAPQALVFVPDAVPQGTDGRTNLTPRPSGPETVNIALKAPQGSEGAGSVVSRNLGLVDILEVSVSRLKPDTVYSVFLEGRDVPVAVLKTNPKGLGMISATGPTREIRPGPAEGSAGARSRVIVIEGEGASAGAPPVLTGG